MPADYLIEIYGPRIVEPCKGARAIVKQARERLKEARLHRAASSSPSVVIDAMAAVEDASMLLRRAASEYAETSYGSKQLEVEWAALALIGKQS